ncbi:MAG: hypothetical protein ACFE0I_25260 [Elainellaceae cyanobacterium]
MLALSSRLSAAAGWERCAPVQKFCVFTMDQDDPMTSEPETCWGKKSGYLYLIGLGICLLSIPFPEDWKRWIGLLGLTVLALGLVADGIDGAVSGRIDGLDEDSSYSKSPIYFTFAALSPFSIASILGFILLNAWMSPDLGENIPPIEDWILPELFFFGFSLMFLASAVKALAAGIIKVGHRFGRLKIIRTRDPFLFHLAVSVEVLFSVGSVWLYFKVIP